MGVDNNGYWVLLIGRGGHELDRIFVPFGPPPDQDSVLKDAVTKFIADMTLSDGDTITIDEGWSEL